MYCMVNVRRVLLIVGVKATPGTVNVGQTLFASPPSPSYVQVVGQQQKSSSIDDESQTSGAAGLGGGAAGLMNWKKFWTGGTRVGGGGGGGGGGASPLPSGGYVFAVVAGLVTTWTLYIFGMFRYFV